MVVSARLTIAAMLVLGVATSGAAQGDPVSHARDLATSGRRPEAVQLLQKRLDERPDDTDARTLLGTVLSWEGDYDGSRRELEAVLATSPTHGDALPALVNVELWSDRAVDAEALAQRGLASRPDNVDLLIKHGRALNALERRGEARRELEHALRIEPGNDEALRVRRALRPELLWSASTSVSTERFNGDRTPWQETTLQLGRATPAGTLLFRASDARRFGLRDQQFEIEMYPSFRPGTYAYVAFGFAPDPVLFPEHRLAADIYQSTGAGFEVSAGVRSMVFAERVNVYTGSISKYYGNWLFTVRTYITPNTVGASRSFHGSFRRYFGSAGTSFAGLRYGRGSSREEIRDVNDIEVLDADVIAANLSQALSRRLGVSIDASYGREELTFARQLRRLSLSGGFNVAF
jgi:YaiO family outer membrane protein